MKKIIYILGVLIFTLTISVNAEYKEETITNLNSSITTTGTEDDFRICTMEYKPVCAKVQIQCIKAPCNPILQTFSNSCMAGDNEIIYNGKCDSKLSDNDISLYNSIKSSKLEVKYQKRVYDILDNYKKIISKKSPKIKNIYNKLMINKIDDYIFVITSKYPQDIVLPENINNKYLMLKLLKIEIEILQKTENYITLDGLFEKKVDYIKNNIDEIVSDFKKEATNGKWYVVDVKFTKNGDKVGELKESEYKDYTNVIVIFEDGHYSYLTKLERKLNKYVPVGYYEFVQKPNENVGWKEIGTEKNLEVGDIIHEWSINQ